MAPVNESDATPAPPVARRGPPVVILSQYFYPDIASTGVFLTELAEDLVREGFEVAVATAQPTYHTRLTMPAEEDYRDIRITRLPALRLSKDRLLGKLLNGLSFAVSLFFYIWRRVPASATLFFVSNPPYIPALGLWFRKTRGQRYVYLIHDVYPDIAVALGYLRPHSGLTRLWERLNLGVLRHAAAVIVLGEAMEEVIHRKAPACDGRLHVIHNWADADFVRPLAKADNPFAREHDLLDRFVLQYSGNIGRFQDLESIIEAADLLREDPVLFLFIGEGGKKARLQEMCRQKGLENVRFLPYVPREILPNSLTSADAALVSMEKETVGLCVPSKLYGILASGVPVLAISDPESEVARIIRRFECGDCVPPRRPDLLAERVRALRADPARCARMGARGRLALEQHFTRSVATAAYAAVLRSLI